MQLVFWVTATIWYCLLILALGDISPDGNNLIVYLSQSSGTDASLQKLCGEDAIDAVILGFVRSFTGTDGHPIVDFGPYLCGGASSKNTVATGYSECDKLGQEVKGCQEKGKKVFVSIGGARSDTSFQPGGRGREKAIQAAKLMWDLFGEGINLQTRRPLGEDVVVDGFDIDLEEGLPDNQDVFVSTLRSYREGASKTIYISAAPGCAITNSTLSRATLSLVDFIFIRFYNSAACALGALGFSQSLKHWYSEIVPSPHLPFPKVFLGGLSFDNNNMGYIPAEEFGTSVLTARRPDFSCWWNENKFGGVALWDGPRGLENSVGAGANFVTYVKGVLVNNR